MHFHWSLVLAFESDAWSSTIDNSSIYIYLVLKGLRTML